jgi:hypothetical protein
MRRIYQLQGFVDYYFSHVAFDGVNFYARTRRIIYGASYRWSR